jgi:hypothetical protein
MFFEADLRDLLSNVWNNFVTSEEPQIKRTKTDSIQLKGSTQSTQITCLSFDQLTKKT